MNDSFPPSGKFIKFCLNVIFIQTEAGVIQGNEMLVYNISSNLIDVLGDAFCVLLQW